MEAAWQLDLAKGSAAACAPSLQHVSPAMGQPGGHISAGVQAAVSQTTWVVAVLVVWPVVGGEAGAAARGALPCFKPPVGQDLSCLHGP